MAADWLLDATRRTKHIGLDWPNTLIYRVGMNLDRHPGLALLGWFPPVYLLGIIRCWGQPWCTSYYGDWISIENPWPALWWPTRLYRQHTQHRRHVHIPV